MFSPEDFGLSFSTAVTPDLSIPQLIETARGSGYSGIELAIAGPGKPPHAHGIDLAIPPSNLAEARHALSDAGVKVSCLATPLVIGGADSEAAATESVDRLKRYVTLAETIGARCVRILGGGLAPAGGEIAGLVDGVADALADAVAFAEQTSVLVLLETCGDFATTKYVREVAKQVYSDSFGILWNVAEPCRALEALEESYDNISGHVRHVHVHDFRYVEARLKLQECELGEGAVPFDRAIEFLAHDGYEGFLSVDTAAAGGPAADILMQHAEVLHRLVTEAFPEPVETEQPS